MLITDFEWELVAANLSHKQVLFDYAEASGVTIGDPGVENGELPYREDHDLAIGYSEGHGLLSYEAFIGEPTNQGFTQVSPAQFLEMCDAYANTIHSTFKELGGEALFK